MEGECFVGSGAYNTYRSLVLPASDKKDIAKIIEEFETFCIGSVGLCMSRSCWRWTHLAATDGIYTIRLLDTRFDFFWIAVRRSTWFAVAKTSVGCPNATHVWPHWVTHIRRGWPTVEHPQTRQPQRLEFYVAQSHEQSILGFHACKDLHLIYR